jgi:hypothetical protein
VSGGLESSSVKQEVWKRRGYKVLLQEQKGKEVYVDDVLHAVISKAACKEFRCSFYYYNKSTSLF